MDANPAAPLRSVWLLVVVCIGVAAAGLTWSAWDMFGGSRRPMLQGWDDSFYYFWLPSVVIDHDVDFSNQLRQSATMNADMRALEGALPRTATGLLENKYPPGWAIASLPFFLAAHLIAPTESTGLEPVYLVAVEIGQLFYAVLGIWFAIKILERSFPRRLAVVAALVGWLASPLIYYQTARLSMSHSQVFALAMAVFWLSLRIRNGETRPWTWGWLGFTAALLVVTRNVGVVYLILPAVVVLRHLRSVKLAAWLFLGALAPAAAQVVAWKVLYGSWIVYSYGGERFDFTHLHLREVLFSARHGWFYWHPLLLGGVAAFLPWGVRHSEGRAWIGSLAGIIALNAAWPTWWLGSSFGHRGFEVPVFFAMIGIAAAWQACADRPARRGGIVAVSALAITWNVALLALFLTHRIPREEPVSYADAVRALVRWIAPTR